MNLSDSNWKHILALTVLVAIVAPFIVYAVPQVVGATQSYVVLSDSMSPAIHAGDVVVVDGAQPSEIEEGDVITFDRPGSETQLVTHRVAEVVQKDGQTKFRTKGDANEEVDQQLVPAAAVVGVVWFHIPLIGYVIQFGSSDLGTLLLLIVPAVLLIISETYALYTDALVDQPDEGTESTESTELNRADEPTMEDDD